tara:strand:+ start:167 stop:622 length:456 start_codon:yes stop_codon:yes gene_type:complete
VGSITIRVSRAIISNKPIPPGIDGIDAPMFVIAVILAAEAKMCNICESPGRILRLTKTEWNNTASSIQIGRDSNKALQVSFQFFKEYRPSTTSSVRLFILWAQFLGSRDVNWRKILIDRGPLSAIATNKPNRIANGKVKITSKNVSSSWVI